MNINRKIKVLHKISRFSFQEEILKESKTFKQKPVEIKMTSQFQRNQMKSRQEWHFGIVMAFGYFALLYKEESFYFPFLQPKEPKIF